MIVNDGLYNEESILLSIIKEFYQFIMYLCRENGNLLHH